MEIIWDPLKEAKLRKERGIDLDEIRGLIEDQRYIEILENPTRLDQVLILLVYKNHMHVVVVKVAGSCLIIKTCYPSRKFERQRKDL